MYAGNLSWSVTDTDLADFMQQAGDVKSAEVVKYPDGRSKVALTLSSACPLSSSRPSHFLPLSSPRACVHTCFACTSASYSPDEPVSSSLPVCSLRSTIDSPHPLVTLSLCFASPLHSRLQGWGLVEFHNAASTVEAINSLSDLDLMGRKIFIREVLPSHLLLPVSSRPPVPSSQDRELGDRDGGAGRGRGVGAIGEPTSRGRGKGKGMGKGGKGKGGGREMEYEAEPTGGTALFVGNVSGPPICLHLILSFPPARRTVTLPNANPAPLACWQLPWSTTWQQLKEIFQEYNVKYADVKMGFDGRSRGYGIVRFDSEEEAYAALALNGYNLDGREILYASLSAQSHLISLLPSVYLTTLPLAAVSQHKAHQAVVCLLTGYALTSNKRANEPIWH